MVRAAARQVSERLLLPGLRLPEPAAPGALGRGLGYQDGLWSDPWRAAAQLHSAGAGREAELLQALLGAPGLFARVELVPEQQSGVWTAVAHRRRTGHLLLVAGASASGKSTLIRRLRRPLPPAAGPWQAVWTIRGQAERTARVLAARAGLTRGRHWGAPVPTKRLWQDREAYREHLLLQYDLSSDPGGARLQAALDVAAGARRITVVTVWVSPERLVRQKRRRQFWRGKSLRRLLAGHAGSAAPDPASVADLYRAYFDALHHQAGLHLIVEADARPRLLTALQWEQQWRAAGGGPPPPRSVSR